MKFTKPALSIPDLVTLLRNRGLNIRDTQTAEKALQNIGYYRLKIYMRPFQREITPGVFQFNANTNFEDIVELYEFDRNLRMICLDALDKIEIALRARIVNQMGLLGTPHFYYNELFFSKPKKSERDAVTTVRNLASKWRHLSIDHYKKKYTEPFLPPIWCLTEATSIGDISKIYADLSTQYRKIISKTFGLPEQLLVSWFRSLSTLRNLCAHHARLWNASIPDAPMPHTDPTYNLHFPRMTQPGSIVYTNINSCYARLLIIRILLNGIDGIDSNIWTKQLLEHLNTRPSLHPQMGFPVGWATSPLWAVTP